MEFNNLITSKGIDPAGVLVFRHCPIEPELRKVLPWLAAERPDTYNAYQRVQRPKIEAAMLKADYVASFIGHESGKALYVGLYRRGASRPLSYDEFWQVPANQEMKAFGMLGFQGDRESCLWFDLEATDFYAEWKGRLVVTWPPPERSWWRWADRNRISIDAIHEASVFDSAMPTWDALALTWAELQALPSKWKSALSQWRGIYFIFDVSGGKGYVGSAYGSDNILGRWLDYATTGHGGNKELKGREPQNFRFSILQRVSPDMDAADVIRLESSWKDRLHTRDYGLNHN